MNMNALLPVIIFVLFLVAAILIGDFFIVKMLQIPLTEAPMWLRAVVHGLTLGVVFYFAIKYLGAKFG